VYSADAGILKIWRRCFYAFITKKVIKSVSKPLLDGAKNGD